VYDELPNTEADDGVLVRRTRWIGGRSDVEFLKMEGGGHTWPGGPQYLPKGIVGEVCRDFDSRYLWEWFKARPKRS
jgi:polyhydroxybutyrate depolymerase